MNELYLSEDKDLIAHKQRPKASRYLKVLCNHFARKAGGMGGDNRGRVQFSAGYFESRAEETALFVREWAESETVFTRLKHVVAEHPGRFGAGEKRQVNWVETGA